MIKGTPEPGKTADAPLRTKVRIELTYDMLSSQLLMKSGWPTVVVAGVLKKAESVTPTEIKEEKLGAPRRVNIDFDMETDIIKVESDASPLIYLGILTMAHSMMTQQQVLQRVQAMAAQPRIHKPS